MHLPLLKLFAPLLSVCILLTLSSALKAAPINKGDFTGANVMFLQVTEDSSTDPEPLPNGLFGPATVSNDSLSFNPSSFGASAGSPNPPVDLTDATLTMTMMTNGSKRIHKVTFNEAGDYTLAGVGGTVNTAVSVGASFFLQVIALDNVGVAPITFTGNMAFSPSGGTSDFVNDPHGPAAIWNGNIMFDIDSLLAAQNPPIVGQATKILLSLDNSLTATAEASTIATIKKKAENGVTIIVDTNVPEPASLALLALGGAVLLSRRKP